MTTAEQTPQQTRSPFWRSHANLVVGLFWGALLLLLLALWIGVKHWESGSSVIVIITAILGVALLAAAGWQTALLVSLKKQPEQQETELLKVRPLLGFFLLGEAIVLAVMVLWLATQQGQAAFGEISSAIVLTVIGMATGLSLLTESAKGFQPQPLLLLILSNRRIFAIGLLFVGLAFFIVGVVLFWFGGRAVDIFPQAAGSMLLGLIFVGGGVWLILASPNEVTPMNMRILILTLGGAAGLVIAVAAIAFAIRWRELVFTGGMELWQGEKAWRLWLCIWIENLGLVLMFGSLLVAYGDIRKNVVLRRLLFGYNTVFMALLLLDILVVINVLVYATFPYNYNWTESQGFYSLSDRSKQILGSLKEPTTVYVLMSQASRDFRDVRTLLENAQAYTNKLRVEYISPDVRDQQYLTILKKFPKALESAKSSSQSAGRGLLIAYGPSKGKLPAPHAFIPQSDLSDRGTQPFHGRNQDQPHAPYEFRGESLVMTQLSFLANDKRSPVVYFTQSNGELNIDPDSRRMHPLFQQLAQQGNADELKSYLQKNNYQVKKLFWMAPPKDIMPGDESLAFSQKKPGSPHEVPADAKVVFIAWPKAPFSKEVLDALAAYMDRGGKLVVMSIITDVQGTLVKTNLEGFLKRYGVDMGQDVILRAIVAGNRLFGADYHQFAYTVPESGNPIAQTFSKYKFFLDMPRTVKPSAGAAGGWRATSILEVRSQGQILWAEKNMNAFRDLEGYVRGLFVRGRLKGIGVREPLSVGVAVTDRDQTPRLVVYGAARMASNSPVFSRNEPPPPYKDLIVSSLEWMAERPENIGIAPKKTNYYRFKGEVAAGRMILLPFGLMSLGILGLGMGIWVVRRN